MSTWVTALLSASQPIDEIFQSLANCLETASQDGSIETYIIRQGPLELSLNRFDLKVTLPSEHKSEVCASQFKLSPTVDVSVHHIIASQYDLAMSEVAFLLKWLFVDQDLHGIVVFDHDFTWALRTAEGFWFDADTMRPPVAEMFAANASPKSLPNFP